MDDLFCSSHRLDWIGFCPDGKPATMKTVKLSNEDEVCDLTGEWDALIENYGEWAKFGSYPNAFKVTLRVALLSELDCRTMDLVDELEVWSLYVD